MNKSGSKELEIIANHTSCEFNLEGVLILLEQQESFFKKSLVPARKWCRLRGNLFFYFKADYYQNSEPIGVIILENFKLVLESDSNKLSFSLVSKSISYHFTALNFADKIKWVEHLQRSSHFHLRSQVEKLYRLVQCTSSSTCIDIEQHRINTGSNLDYKKPWFELCISCDNLRCKSIGIPPSPVISIYILNSSKFWIKLGETEIGDKCSNKHFSRTFWVYESDGVCLDTKISIIVSDVCEKLTGIRTQIGTAQTRISELLEHSQSRLIILSALNQTVGFVSVSVHVMFDNFRHTTPFHFPKMESCTPVLRRAESLPSNLNSILTLPNYCCLKAVFQNPEYATFRFTSSLGGEINVLETMSESFLCFRFAQQLIKLWLKDEIREKEDMLLLGHLKEDWFNKQKLIVNQHNTIISLYEIALASVADNVQKDTCFKKSIYKLESSLEFVPINLHLQRTYARTTARNNFTHDIYTVGAFAANSAGFKNGGLLSKMRKLNSMYSNSENAFNDKSQLIEDVTKTCVRLATEISLLLKRIVRNLASRQLRSAVETLGLLEIKVKLFLESIDSCVIQEGLNFLEQIREDVQNSHKTSQKIAFSRRFLDRQNFGLLDLEEDSRQLNCYRNMPDNSSKRKPKNPKNFPSKNVQEISEQAENTSIPEKFSQGDKNFIPPKNKKFYQVAPAKSENVKSSHANSGNISMLNETEILTNSETNLGRSKNEAESQGSKNVVKLKAPVGFSRRPQFAQNIFSSAASELEQQITADRNNFVVDEPWDLIRVNVEASLISLSSKILSISKMESFQDNLSLNSSSLSSENSQCDSHLLKPREVLNVISQTKGNQSAENLDLKTQIPETSQQNSNSNNSFLHSNLSPLLKPREVLNVISQTKGNQSAENLDLKTQSPETSQQNSNSNNSFLHSNLLKDNAKNIPSLLPEQVQKINDLKNLSCSDLKNDESMKNSFSSSVASVDLILEIGPSVRKLSKAINTMLETMKLVNNACKLQRTPQLNELSNQIKYRRNVCLSQALISVATSLLGKFWCSDDLDFVPVFCSIGALIFFEGLLSCYKEKTGRFEDMIVAVEDLNKIEFILVPVKLFNSEVDLKNFLNEFRFCESRDNFESTIKIIEKFTLNSLKPNNDFLSHIIPLPKIIGTKNNLKVILPVPDDTFSTSISNYGIKKFSFRVTPLFFNVGINEEATLASVLKTDSLQDCHNQEHLQRLKNYFKRHEKFYVSNVNKVPTAAQQSSFKINELKEHSNRSFYISNTETRDRSNSLYSPKTSCNKNRIGASSTHLKSNSNTNSGKSDNGVKNSRASISKRQNNNFEENLSNLRSLLQNIESEINKNVSKNVKILELAARFCDSIGGIRFTSCKSAKDRTGMSVTLELVRKLHENFGLSDSDFKNALDCIRARGTRLKNCKKNIGESKYSFSCLQLKFFPHEYRPPAGSYGSGIT